jgi:hypothetical protein
MHVGWSVCEFGAPEIDPKRPYGNSWVLGDIHEILTGEDIDELTESQKEEYRQLHEETQTALQIILSMGKFEEGLYIRTNPYSSTWVPYPLAGRIAEKSQNAT